MDRKRALGKMNMHEAQVLVLFIILVILWFFKTPVFITGSVWKPVMWKCASHVHLQAGEIFLQLKHQGILKLRLGQERVATILRNTFSQKAMFLKLTIFQMACHFERKLFFVIFRCLLALQPLQFWLLPWFSYCQGSTVSQGAIAYGNWCNFILKSTLAPPTTLHCTTPQR